MTKILALMFVLFSSPLLAQNVTNKEYILGLAERFKQIEVTFQINVSIVCKDNKILAIYNPVYNAFIICQKNIPDNEKLETVVHEVIHLAQDCAAGIDNEYVSQLFPNKADTIAGKTAMSTLLHIKEGYPKKKRLTELEAYYFEDYPTTSLKLLDMFCLGKFPTQT